MNAALANVTKVLWRWTRRIARARSWKVLGAAILGLISFATFAQPVWQNSTTAEGTGNGSVSKPSGVVSGDLLIAGVMYEKGTAETITAAGWTPILKTDNSTNAGIATFYKVAGGSEPASYSFNFSNGSKWAIGISRITGADTSNPVNVSGGTPGASSTSVTAPSVTTTVGNTLVLAFYTNKKPATYTIGTATERYDDPNNAGGLPSNMMATFVQASAGATGNKTATASEAEVWVGQQVAIRPLPVTLSSAANQTFNLGDPSTLASVLTVTGATITATNDLRIRIPATFSMTWDTAVTTVTLGGAAAGKVSTTLSAYENGNRTVVLNVTSNFAAADQLTITGLRFANFTVAEAADNLELVVAGAGGATADDDDKTIAITDVGISSAGSRILNDNAGRTPVAAEGVDVTSWNKSAMFLVTIGIQTTTGGGGADCRNGQGNNKLQWRNVTDAPGVWNSLGTAAGPEMRLFNSANLTHGNNLTAGEAQITGTGTYIQGEEVENNNDFDWSNRTRNGDHTAIQFPINPSGGIDGKQYQFRFIVDELCFNDSSGVNVVSVNITLAAAPPPVVIGGFNAYETSTAAGATAGVIKTKIAGSAITLDMIALNAAKTAIETTFTGTVRVEVLNASDNSGAIDGNGCRPTWTLIQTLSPDPSFTDGRDSISFTQANSYPNVRLRITYPAGAPTTTGCSSDNFAIRPSSFASFALTDTDWQTAGTSRALNLLTFAATTPTHKAGRPFSVRATAVNAAAATTTNYVGAPTATLSGCAAAACTATFGTLTLATTFAAGQLVSDVASYDNVGSFRVELVDSSFASVDTADSSALEREIRSGTADVGRFVPDHFAVSVTTPPFFGTACGSFTYIGQAFNYTVQPVFTVTAQDFANNTTTLYAGSWWRITNTTLDPATQNARYSAAIGTLVYSGLPAVGGDPVICFTGSGCPSPPPTGQGTLTFSSGSGLSFTRTTPTAPASPYDADISLAINVIDADGVTYASNPARFGTATAGNGIAFNNNKQMRFGRLAIRNANGSQLVPLPVQVEAQYWLGAPTNAFVTNTADSCTVIAANNDAMGNFTSNLSGSPTCETAISGGGALSAGRRTLQLAAPGSGNNGSVDITVNLGAAASGTTCTTLGGAPVAATTANLPYLQGNWSGGAYDQNPSARGAFGVYRGAEEVVHIRENFQ